MCHLTLSTYWHIHIFAFRGFNSHCGIRSTFHAWFYVDAIRYPYPKDNSYLSNIFFCERGRHLVINNIVACWRACPLTLQIPVPCIYMYIYIYGINHFSDVIMGVSVVYSTVCSDGDQRKLQGSASLTFVRGIHRWSVNFLHKGTVIWKMFPFDDSIMYFVISTLADNLAANSAWPSVSPMMTTGWYKHVSSKFPVMSCTLVTFSSPDDVIQNSRRDLDKSRGTLSVNQGDPIRFVRHASPTQ